MVYIMVYAYNQTGWIYCIYLQSLYFQFEHSLLTMQLQRQAIFLFNNSFYD
jgi:hypothetical protein